MDIHNPKRSRLRINEAPEQTTIVIAARNGCAAAFFAVWLLAWIGGASISALELLPGEQLRGIWAWLAWAAAGFLGAVLLAWHGWGREVILLRDDTLTYRWGIGPFGRARTFSLGAVRRLRLAEGSDEAGLVFEAAGHRVRFGTTLERPESEEVLRVMTRRLPR